MKNILNDLRKMVIRRVASIAGHNFSFAKLKNAIEQSENKQGVILVLSLVLGDETQWKAARWKKLSRQFMDTYRPQLLSYFGGQPQGIVRKKMSLGYPTLFWPFWAYYFGNACF